MEKDKLMRDIWVSFFYPRESEVHFPDTRHINQKLQEKGDLLDVALNLLISAFLHSTF